MTKQELVHKVFYIGWDNLSWCEIRNPIKASRWWKDVTCKECLKHERIRNPEFKELSIHIEGKMLRLSYSDSKMLRKGMSVSMRYLFDGHPFYFNFRRQIDTIIYALFERKEK